MSSKLVYVILVVALVLNASANILMKLGMLRIGASAGLTALLGRLLTEPQIVGGVACFGFALLAYSWVLARVALSIAYPVMTSGGFLIVILFSWLSLKETITLVQTAGFIFIVVGVWMVAR